MNLPFKRKEPQVNEQVNPLADLKASTIAALEGIEELRKQVGELSAQNTTLFKEATTHRARAEVLQTLLSTSERDKDYYLRMNSELITELRRVQTTIDDVFARVKAKLAEDKPDPRADVSEATAKAMGVDDNAPPPSFLGKPLQPGGITRVRTGDSSS